VAQLERVLGAAPFGIERATELLDRANEPLTPAGRPMYAGLVAQPVPDSPVGLMWRLGDQLREFRGDAHVAAFAGAGFSGCDIQVLTERCAQMPPRSYASGRGWTEEDQAIAEANLADRGLLQGDGPTLDGLAAREEVEVATDWACAAMVDALGDDLADLVRILRAWGTVVRAANGYYPSSPQEAIPSTGAEQWLAANGMT
jgi:hypothetical protein